MRAVSSSRPQAIKAELLKAQLRLLSLSYSRGGRRDGYIYAHGATTLLALALVLNTIGIGLFCWAIFALAV